MKYGLTRSLESKSEVIKKVYFDYCESCAVYFPQDHLKDFLNPYDRLIISEYWALRVYWDAQEALKDLEDDFSKEGFKNVPSEYLEEFQELKHLFSFLVKDIEKVFKLGKNFKNSCKNPKSVLFNPFGG